MIVDSDVVIWHVRQHTSATQFLEAAVRNGRVYASVLTVAEVFAGKHAMERRRFEQLLTVIEPLDVTTEIALQAGEFRRTFGPSHGTGLTDCVVAATAVAHGMPVATLNVKHFPMIRGLKPAFKL